MNAPAKKETQIETVKMDDERLVDFPGKRILQKDSFIDADGTVKVRLDWRNGETRTFTIPAGLLAKFAAHGAEQKLGDEISGLKKTDGSDADIEDKILAVDDLIERLNGGEWSTRKEGGGMAGTSVLIRALVEVYGKPVSEIKAYIKPFSQAEKMALRNHPAIKPVVARLEAEKAAASSAKVDTGSLLAGLGEIPG
jgi:hypothetical protein